VSFDPEPKHLKDDELEMVVQVIRRGLSVGNQLEVLEERLTKSIATLQECRRRLKEQNRIGLEIARMFQRAIDPIRKAPLTQAEAIERLKWINQKESELKAQLEIEVKWVNFIEVVP
jgi:hypothetical protein